MKTSNLEKKHARLNSYDQLLVGPYLQFSSLAADGVASVEILIEQS